MTIHPPVLVTRAHVGKGPGMVLISLGAPAGNIGRVQVEVAEVLRLAMTHDTFREITQLFVRTLNEIEPQPPRGPPPEKATFGRSRPH
jgi:hypothetical protein